MIVSTNPLIIGTTSSCFIQYIELLYNYLVLFSTLDYFEL